MSTKEQINDNLNSLVSINGLKGASLVRRDGLSIAAKFKEGVNAKQVGAMTASTVGSSKTAAQTLELGGIEEIAIRCGNGELVAIGIGDQVILALLLEEEAEIEEIRDQVTEIADQIQTVL